MEIKKFQSMKGSQAIVVLTCYDYNTAQILEEEGVEVILVGDSLGNVVLGYDSTKEVTMADMIRHTQAVRKGAITSFIVADMPYKSDEKDVVVKNANLLLDAGADAVKVEGNPDAVKVLNQNGINVMGHIGYLPQTAEKVILHGNTEELLKEARAIQEAGAFAIVFELVHSNSAETITKLLNIPTIGIGSGSYCDGQVLVVNDMLGMYEKFKPKFVKRYVHVNDEIRKAVRGYKKEVKSGEFPGKEYTIK